MPDPSARPARFAAALPGLFNDFPRSEHPRDRRLERVLAEVAGLARENNLALLNLAASLLEPGESYVEVGTFRGTSLIAAMLGNAGEFVAVDDFSMGDGSLSALEENVARFGLPLPVVLEGDAFEVVRGGALGDRRVGVYYYDAAHSYEAQLEGLRMIEPWLAPAALVIVDDSDWEQVGRALDDYLASQPRARQVNAVEGSTRGQPWWWEGMRVLAWDG